MQSTTLTTRQLILPYVDLDIKYYDLGLEYRDKVRYTLLCGMRGF